MGVFLSPPLLLLGAIWLTFLPQHPTMDHLSPGFLQCSFLRGLFLATQASLQSVLPNCVTFPPKGILDHNTPLLHLSLPPPSGQVHLFSILRMYTTQPY